MSQEGPECWRELPRQHLQFAARLDSFVVIALWFTGNQSPATSLSDYRTITTYNFFYFQQWVLKSRPSNWSWLKRIKGEKFPCLSSISSSGMRITCYNESEHLSSEPVWCQDVLFLLLRTLSVWRENISLTIFDIWTLWRLTNTNKLVWFRAPRALP